MAWHRRVLGPAMALLVAGMGAGCGDDESGGPGAPVAGPRDSGPDEPGGYDAGPLPDLPVEFDASALSPGDPPVELEGERCAVDTNKLWSIVSGQGNVMAAALAVDLFQNRFGVGFIGDGMCLDGAFVAELEGPSGGPEPEKSEAFDPCSTIHTLAISHNTTDWLFATVDNRMDGYDVWVQAFRPGSEAVPANRITESSTEEIGVAVVGLPPNQALVAWTERDAITGATALKVRPLDAVGVPAGDAVTLEEDDGGGAPVLYGDLTLSLIGDTLVGLGYVRSQGSTVGEAVLRVLGYDGNPVRDEWVLATDARVGGTVDLAADETGGAVIYGRALGGDARQLWFQQLGEDGEPALNVAGAMVLGPIPATRIVNSPDMAIDASIAQLPNGFAIVYRALAGGRLQPGDERIMVQFVDRFGGVRGAPSAIALAEPVGGKTAIKAAYDGRVVVAWNDVDESGERTLTAIRLPCVGGRL